MRSVSGGIEPRALTQWRLRTPGVAYDSMPGELRDTLKTALVNEQRGLCAYTGIRVEPATSHIEHLLPQAHCTEGQNVAYGNMVACYPRPGAHADFGAVKKGNWPPPEESHLFVSPRSDNCESRFVFALDGRIAVANDRDEPAKKTIQKLGLDHRALDRRRKEAIDATLVIRGKPLDLRTARRRLMQLERAEAGSGRLEQFCFVLKQALERHIRRLEAIKRSKRGME